MWNSKWLNLVASLEEVERQAGIREDAYSGFRVVDNYVERTLKAKARRKCKNNILTGESLEELKMQNGNYSNAHSKCVGAELSLRVAKSLSVDALNELLGFVGCSQLDSEMGVVIQLIRFGDEAWDKNACFREVGSTDPYVEVFYAPKDTLDPDYENSVFQVRHGHISISSAGITYLRKHNKRRGTHNWFTKPLRSAPTPSSC